jgi:stress-induced-phosphoprotein 1
MSAQEFKDLGNKAFQNQDYQIAIEHYSNAISLEDDNHVFYSNRSGAYLAVNQLQEALDDANKCIELKPSFPKGFARRGAVLTAMKHWSDAIKAYQHASQMDPSNDSYRQSIAECQKAMAPPQPSSFSPFGGNMIQRLEENPQTKALVQNPSVRAAMLEIEANPSNLSKHASNPAVMACLQSLLGITPEMQAKAAQEEYEEEQKRKRLEEDRLTRPVSTPSMARDTTNVDDLNKKEVEEEYIDEELEKEKKERKEKREKADKIKEEGAALYKKRDFENAILKFKEAVDVDDTNPVYLMNVAACYSELQQLDHCVQACKDALNTSPITPQQKSKCYARMANAYAKQKQYPESIQMFKKAILEDNVPSVRQQLRQTESDYKKFQTESYYDDEKSELAKEDGNKAYAAGEYAKAIDFYTDAIKRNPSNYKVYSNRALCYTKVCAWEKGMEDCDKCLSFDPKFVKALLRKGKILHFLKSYHKAMTCFQDALAIEPNNTDVMEAIRATQTAIYSTHDSTPGGNEARLAEAMKDPEIQLAMSNPQVQKLLQDMQTNPEVAMKAFQDPQTAPILEKLVAAGIIKLG